jgi:hypothetical protein
MGNVTMGNLTNIDITINAADAAAVEVVPHCE